MTAASFWSLLEPAFKIAHEQNQIPSQLNFLLIIIGFLLGAVFVYIADLLLPSLSSKHVFQFISNKKTELPSPRSTPDPVSTLKMNPLIRARLKRNQDGPQRLNKLHVPIGDSPMEEIKELKPPDYERTKWNRLVLLIIAVTVHNFPGSSTRILLLPLNGAHLSRRNGGRRRIWIDCHVEQCHASI